MTGWWDFDDLTDQTHPRPPSEDASPLEWLCYEQDRVLTRRQALMNMSAGALRHRVASGRWGRVHPGVFVAHTGPLTHAQRQWAAVLSAGPHAVLAGLSAARAGGLRRAPGRVIDVLVPGPVRAFQPGRAWSLVDGVRVVLHRSTTLPDKDVIERARPPRTSMARSVVDGAQWAATEDAARALIAAACRQRLVGVTEIAEVVHRMPRARRRAIVLETIGLTARGSEALSEISFIRLCRRFGLPRPDQQTRRRDAAGRLRYVDATWTEYGVAAEVDGTIHDEPEVRWDDMFRQNDVWIEGERMLRFPDWALRHRPLQVAGQLRRALLAGGWRPPGSPGAPPASPGAPPARDLG